MPEVLEADFWIESMIYSIDEWDPASMTVCAHGGHISTHHHRIVSAIWSGFVSDLLSTSNVSIRYELTGKTVHSGGWY